MHHRPLLLALLLFALTPLVSAQNIPKGFIVPSDTLSPDKHYGVTVPVLADHDDDNDKSDEPKNSLVDTRDGQLLGAIEAHAGWDRMNRGRVLPARWSPDGKLLLWEVEGRWSPAALVLIKIANNKLSWQVDLLTAVQQSILIRTHQAAPTKYAAAKKWNEGNGSAFPDGFNVNVRAEGDKERGGPGEDVQGKPITLPMRIHAELTANPKEIEDCPKEAQLDAELDGIVDEQGKLTVSKFRLRKKPFSNATASSWLELTDPDAAKHAPLEYGDVVSLKGRVSTKNDAAGKPAYFLTLSEKVSVPASGDNPAENNVSEVRLLGFPIEGLPEPDVKAMGICDAEGTLDHSHVPDQHPALTLKVRGYGYSSR